MHLLPAVPACEGSNHRRVRLPQRALEEGVCAHERGAHMQREDRTEVCPFQSVVWGGRSGLDPGSFLCVLFAVGKSTQTLYIRFLLGSVFPEAGGLLLPREAPGPLGKGPWQGWSVCIFFTKTIWFVNTSGL